LIWKVLFSALGLISLGSILHGYGFHKLYLELAGLGWWFIPLAFSFVPVAVCYTGAWLLTLPELSIRRFPRLLQFTLASIAWNNLSPFVKVLGEPVRAIMLEQLVSRKAALKSVVLYNLVHALGTLLAFLIGTSLILFLFPVAETIRIAFLSLFLVFFVLFLVAYLLPRLNIGGKKKPKAKNLFWKIGFWIRWGLAKIRGFSRVHPHRFWLSILVEALARFLEGFTFYVAFRAVGDPLSPLHCALLDVGRALMDNIFFFIPYQVGSREASLLLLCKNVLHEGVASAVSVAILYRLVEIFWIATGYLVWMRVSRSSKDST
jgi:hypothetical protein